MRDEMFRSLTRRILVAIVFPQLRRFMQLSRLVRVIGGCHEAIPDEETRSQGTSRLRYDTMPKRVIQRELNNFQANMNPDKAAA